MQRRDRVLEELEQLGLAETVQTPHGPQLVYSEKAEPSVNAWRSSGP